MARRSNNFINLSGRKFNRLKVIDMVVKINPKRVLWKCKCDCGGVSIVRGGRLRTGETKSCGCLVPESNRANKTKHGEAANGKETREYVIWVKMRQRCLDPNAYAYERYGGAGVKICKQWDNYANFLADMGRAPSKSHTLDRFPKRNGDYKPSNCRWATPKEQARNRDWCKLFTFQGQSFCLTEWAERLGLNYRKLYYRVTLGWSLERAFAFCKIH